MKKLSVLTIAGSRLERILFTALMEMAPEDYDYRLFHTGEEETDCEGMEFYDFPIEEVQCFLDAVGKNEKETIETIMERAAEVFKILKPDVYLVLGDSNSSYAAISARKLKIPVFQVLDGKVLHDKGLSEESTKKLVKLLSNVKVGDDGRGYLQIIEPLEEQIEEEGKVAFFQ